MSFKVLTTSDFEKYSKRLVKKYRSLKNELLALISSLEENPAQGTAIGSDCYKIRIAIKSKGKGKSGGARVVTCVKVADNHVVHLRSMINPRKITSPTRN